MLLAPRGAAHTARYRRAVRRGKSTTARREWRGAGLRKITNRRILYNINNVSATSRAAGAASAPAPLPSRPAPASAFWRQPGANHDWREPGTILAMVAPLTAVAHLSRSW